MEFLLISLFNITLRDLVQALCLQKLQLGLLRDMLFLELQISIINSRQMGGRKLQMQFIKKEVKYSSKFFHCGRATHPQINGNLDVLAPSAIAVR